MKESWKTRLMRWSFYLYPCYFGTGGKVTYISEDWKELTVKVPYSRMTRNYVGTIFGGSMFAATDPMYMLMLIKILGPQYVVWDKAGSIRFKKPGRSHLTAHFRITDEDLQAIRDGLAESAKVERTFTTSLVDEHGEVHATVERLIHIRRK